MALELICPFCGHPNGLGKIFCSSCGQNMQQGDKPPKIIGKGQRSGAGRLFGAVLKICFLLALVAFLVGIFWPVKAGGMRNAGREFEADLAAFQSNYRKFEGDMGRVTAGEMERAVLILAETQVNAFLKTTLDANNGKVKARGAMTPQVTDVRVDFRNQAAVLFLAYQIGPATMTYEVTLDPGNKENGFALARTGARIGHLPLPPIAFPLAVSKFEALLRGLHTAKFIVDRAYAYEFVETGGQGRAAIAFMKTKPPPRRESP